ncbi:MAG TPA: dephospho-CoA kinase [Chitinophagales bacterium]|nr:dephospho-CoA kinase [Chitinophagales bacterium]
MLKVGITGGIGSGKTTVCKIFELLGISVYYSDLRAKQLMTENQLVKQQILQLLGHEAYSNNKLNTKYISKIVFNDKIMLNRLKAIVHPAVYADAEDWFKQHQNENYVLYESALLLVNGKNNLVDKVILVIADIESRVQRVIDRDKSDRNSVLQRIQSQSIQENLIPFADFIVNNNQDYSQIEFQVLTIHNQLTN